MKGRIGMLTPLDSATGKPPSTGFPTPLLSGKQQPTGGISTKSVRAKADAGLIGRGGHASIMPEQGLPRVDSARRRSTGWPHDLPPKDATKGLAIGITTRSDGVVVGEAEELLRALYQAEVSTGRAADALLKPHPLHPRDVLEQ